MNKEELKIFLDEKVDYYNQPSFIENDPIRIPHRFTKKQDIEIAGFFAAIFAWGIRKTIINKSLDLLNRMDNSPHEFILHHDKQDLKGLLGFKHRTFNDVDLLFLVDVFKRHYSKNDSLETAFISEKKTQQARLEHFYDYLFSYEHLKRTQKHISTPAKNSACKRINMYLRWMIRKDKRGVDFGIWNNMSPADLIIPMDVHVCRVSEKLGLLEHPKANWKQAVMLTQKLRQFDANDPVKYDFALFGMGVAEK